MEVARSSREKPGDWVDLRGVMSLNARLEAVGWVLRIHQSFGSRPRLLAVQNVRRPPAGPPILLAEGGEKVTLRQVARYAAACSLGTSPVLSGAASGEGIRHKLVVLRQYCEEIGRPYDTILRTHFTGWLILPETEAAAEAKVRHYMPGGVEQRFSGRWRDWVVAATPERAASYFQELVDASLQYFISGTLDAADEETIRLLAGEVVPRVRPCSRN